MSLQKNRHLALAAAPALEAIGAWGKATTTAGPGSAARPALTEEVGHILLGLALGYPVCDVRALHAELLGGAVGRSRPNPRPSTVGP